MEPENRANPDMRWAERHPDISPGRHHYSHAEFCHWCNWFHLTYVKYEHSVLRLPNCDECWRHEP